MTCKKIVVLISQLLLFSFISSAFSQSEMTLKEYQAQLELWKQREAKVAGEVNQIENEISSIVTGINKTGSELKKIRQAIFQLIEAKESEVNEFRRKLEELEKAVDKLGKNIGVDISGMQKETNKQIAACWKNKISATSEINKRLSQLEKKMVLINLKMMGQSSKSK